MALTLADGDQPGGLVAALDMLRGAAGADDAELFLMEPGGHDAVLTSCAGADTDALAERDRFAPGVGYPGIIISQGRRIVTRHLIEDGRFLRVAVKERGIHCYACVPIPGDQGPLGSLHLAWRREDADVDAGSVLLGRAAPIVSMAMRARAAQLGNTVRRELDRVRQGRERSRALLTVLTRAAGARDGALLLRKNERAAFESDGTRGGCDAELCPMLHGGVQPALGVDRSTWPRACRGLPPSAISPCCLPIWADGWLQGAVVIDYGRSAPLPGTRDAFTLLTMVREGVRLLSPASDAHPSSADWESSLSLRCLGPFEVRIRDRLVPRDAFTRRKAIALLQILILHAGSPVDRAVLMEQLWPHVDERTGKNRLHGVVHALRQVIEPEADARRWLYIQNQGEFYHFNMEAPSSIDLYRFRKLLASAFRAAGDQRVSDAISQLEEALGLYRGDLFEDDRYADFCALERGHLRGRCLDGYRRLAGLYEGEQQPDLVVRTLRRGIELEPTSEDLHRWLVETLLSLGRRKEALDQYRECERILRSELDAEPEVETRQLERLLLGGSASA